MTELSSDDEDRSEVLQSDGESELGDQSCSSGLCFERLPTEHQEADEQNRHGGDCGQQIRCSGSVAPQRQITRGITRADESRLGGKSGDELPDDQRSTDHRRQ